MATITHLVTNSDTGNLPNASSSFDPTTGDLLVVVITIEASTADHALTSSIAGNTFTQVRKQVHLASVESLFVYVADQLIAAGEDIAQTVTIATGGAGSIHSVYAVSGMPASSVGASAIRGQGGTSNQAAGAPAPATSAFAQAALTTNPILAAVANSTSPAGMTSPASPFNESQDVGYTTGQDTGLETAFCNSGFTGTVVTWGSNSATESACIAVELNASLTYTEGVRSGTIVVGGTRTESYSPPPTGILDRRFDGLNDEIRCSIGASNLTGAHTVAALVRRTRHGAGDVIVSNYDAANTRRLSLGFDVNDKVNSIAQNGSTSVTEADGWVLIAYTKAATTVTPRAHIFKGGSWVHEPMSGAQADPVTQAGGTVRFAVFGTLAWYPLDIAVVAEWTSELSDANIEALHANSKTQDWADLSPAGLWDFNQADVATALTDLTGNGANQSLIEGTTVNNDGPAGWIYGAGVSHSDSPTGRVVVSGSVTRSTSHVSSPIGRVILSGTRIEGKATAEVRTGSVILSGTRTESYGRSFRDNPSGVIVLSATRVERKSAVDTRSGTVVLSGSRIESNSRSESRAGTIVLGGTRIEGKAATDSKTGSVILSGTRTESSGRGFFDNPIGAIVLSGSRVEGRSAAESPTGLILLSGSVVESYVSAGTSYTDNLTGTLVVAAFRDFGWEWHEELWRRYPVEVMADAPAVYLRFDDVVDRTVGPPYYYIVADPPGNHYVEGGLDSSTHRRWAALSTDGESGWLPVADGGLVNDPSGGLWHPGYTGRLEIYESFYGAYGERHDTDQYSPFTGDQAWTAEWILRHQSGDPSVPDGGGLSTKAVFLQTLSGGIVEARIPYGTDDVAFQVFGTTVTWTNVGIGTDTWHQVVIRFNPSNTVTVGELPPNTAELFVDGVSKGQQTQTGNYFATTGILLSGIGGWDSWYGDYDEFSFYETVLTAARIRTHYEAAFYTYNDAPTGTVVLSGSASESYAAAGAVTYDDSATGTIVLSGTAPEAKSASDSPSGVLVLSGSKVEAQSRSESRSGSLIISGSVAENRIRSDVVSGRIILSGTRVESRSIADTRSGQITLSGTVSRSSSHSSSPTGVVVLSGTRVESWQVQGIFIDSPTGVLVVSGSRTESQSRTEARSGTIVLSGSRVEQKSAAETRTGTLVVSGSRVESNTRTESRTGVITVSGTRVESYNVAGTYVDAPVGRIIVSGTRTESSRRTEARSGQIVLSGSVSERYQPPFKDNPTGTIVLSGSRAEVQSRSESRTGRVIVSGSVQESWTKGYTDVRSGSIILSGTVSEALRFVETPVGSIILSGSVTDSAEYVGALLGEIILTGSVHELYVPSGSAFHYPFGIITISGSVEEIHSRWDWVDGERWPGDTDSRWEEDVGERWDHDSDTRWGDNPTADRWEVDPVA